MTEQILGPGSVTDQLIRRLKKQNKDKEWSLKDKKYHHGHDGDVDEIKDFYANQLNGNLYYSKEDIETLRQKLIEDIDNIIINITCMFPEDEVWKIEKEARDNARKIINRRFGLND